MPEFVDKLRTGDPLALNELTAALYDQLHRIASRHVRGERSDHTLQPTALIHEAYIKLLDRPAGEYSDKAHFLAVASRVMRHVLVDYARARSTQKRAGNAKEPLWTTNLEVADDKGIELIDMIELDSAIGALAAEDENLARLIEMRYFGGMTAEETAAALGVSVHVVRHDLRFAQAWLRRKMKG
jgi:RNA polymerase sigma factor (TIGR02999 family)